MKPENSIKTQEEVDGEMTAGEAGPVAGSQNQQDEGNLSPLITTNGAEQKGKQETKQ